MATSHFKSNIHTAGTLTALGLATFSAGAVVTGDLSGVGDIERTGHIEITAPSGSGFIAVTGSSDGTGSGGQICVHDRDDGGYTVIDTLNGTMSGRIALSGECNQ